MGGDTMRIDSANKSLEKILKIIDTKQDELEEIATFLEEWIEKNQKSENLVF